MYLSLLNLNLSAKESARPCLFLKRTTTTLSKSKSVRACTMIVIESSDSSLAAWRCLSEESLDLVVAIYEATMVRDNAHFVIPHSSIDGCFLRPRRMAKHNSFWKIAARRALMPMQWA